MSDGKSGGLTEEDYQRIREFTAKDPSERNPEDLIPDSPEDDVVPAGDETDESGSSSAFSTGIQRSTCESIRRRMADATTAKEVVDEYPQRHTSEIMRHAYGDCKCRSEVPPTASPQIKRGECKEFRKLYSGGHPVSEIADVYARSDNSVTRHIFGRCSHPDTPRDKSPSEVEEWECKRIRETYKRNPKVDLPAVATAMRLRREVAAYHLFGLCECEHGEGPAYEKRPIDDRRVTPVDPEPVDKN